MVNNIITNYKVITVKSFDDVLVGAFDAFFFFLNFIMLKVYTVNDHIIFKQ